jgi:adenosyl cobinamide kinase/adenosyl cobinamide phosphate guanylyltransferase
MIIEVDKYKDVVDGYDASRSEDFHIQSAKLADGEFKKCLQSKKYKRIIFMAGGTASGKTEYSTSFLTHKDQLVYDGTLKEFDGFKIKLQKIQKYDKNKSKVKVVLIIPFDWVVAFEAFLKRERKMKMYTFFDTQINSKLTVAKILKDTKYRVEIYVSKYDEKNEKLSYIRIKNIKRTTKSKLLIDLANSMKRIAEENGFDIKTKIV